MVRSSINPVLVSPLSVDISAGAGTNNLLHARNVKKAFNGVPALKDGQLDLAAGSVHALCGGNGAGKSTFLNILTGIIRKDGGEIFLRGVKIDFHSPKQAHSAGIAIIAQELSPIRDMTVAENLFLGREPRQFKYLVDKKTLNRQASELLDRLKFGINPRLKMRDLSIAQTQLVEIAKAISHNANVLIMDEPTSSLGVNETASLFGIIRSLAQRGIGIIYVSHRTSEVFTIADAYTVFRDGQFIEAGRMQDINRRHLLSQIIGRDLRDQFPAIERKPTVAVLEVKNLNRTDKFRDISLTVRQGEILGIYGLVGSGRTEFLTSLFGLDRVDGGQILIDGKPVDIATPQDAMNHRIMLVTEDRKETGLVLTLSVRDNISLSSLPALSRFGVVTKGTEAKHTRQLVDKFRIKATSTKMEVRFLSGGNQQKVVLARCLETKPRILLLDEPTRGVDAGAKEEIYTFMGEFVGRTNCIIMVSSEVDEIIGMSDRIAVFRRGMLSEIVNNIDLKSADLLQLAS
jgi:putative xylitol transport system ATP-binding protein